ncbi:hypothetical protein BDV12DRAFT_162931 [Aspergillus spectabilis]
MMLNHLAVPITTYTEAQTLPQPGLGTSSKEPEEERPPDPNIADPRFNINRPCIYERRLPGNAYITAHVQRLQHGYYSTPVVSDQAIDHVNFLAVSFVFHSPDTLCHRFKAATIRASLHSAADYTSKHDRSRSSHRSRNKKHHPRFLMHAPHLLYGSVSPETLQWSYSLTGSLGIAQLPLIASLSPAAGLNGRFCRYEMMRIQGSVRTLNNNPASQIVWTLEENTLQRSGLPREFTFVMLIADPDIKSHSQSRVQFVLEIEPVLQSWFGSYPLWWLGLFRRYRATRRKKGVDFRSSLGQRFGPIHVRGREERGKFNFAKLVGGFEEYVSLSGRRVVMMPGGVIEDDTDGPMPMPLPLPNPNPNPNPYPMPMPMPYPGGQDPELGPRQPQTPRRRLDLDLQSVNETARASNRSPSSAGRTIRSRHR